MGHRYNMVKWFATRIGTREGSEEHKRIIDVYNTLRPLPRGYMMRYGDSWCAASVTVAAMETGNEKLIPPECGCGEMKKYAKQRGIWAGPDYRPQMGDLILYSWNMDAWPDHIGIVYSYNKNTDLIRTIEGNYQDQIKSREIVGGSGYINGYICPKYETLDGEDDTELRAVAEAVIRGKYGNGLVRRLKLAAAGYSYDDVQALVNKILKERRTS